MTPRRRRKEGHSLGENDGFTSLTNGAETDRAKKHVVVVAGVEIVIYRAFLPYWKAARYRILFLSAPGPRSTATSSGQATKMEYLPTTRYLATLATTYLPRKNPLPTSAP